MKKIIILFLIFMHISTCAGYTMHMPKIKPDARRQMQEHIYKTQNKDQVMQAVIVTLQDSDYMIEDINKELGFIRASKTFKAHYVNKKRLAGWTFVLAAATAYTVFSYGSTAATMYSPTRRVANEMKDKTVVVNCNVFVDNINNETKVKFIPVAKVLQNADGFSFFNNNPIKIWRFYKPTVYNEFFAQVNNYIEQSQN